MTAPVQVTKRADELAAGQTVVAGAATLTVGAVRKGSPGEVDIRWAGSEPWATVKADRVFTLVQGS